MCELLLATLVFEDVNGVTRKRKKDGTMDGLMRITRCPDTLFDQPVSLSLSLSLSLTNPFLHRRWH